MKLTQSLPSDFIQHLAKQLWGAVWQPWPIRYLGLLCGLLTVSALMMALLHAADLKSQVDKARSIVAQNNLRESFVNAKQTTQTSVISAAQAKAMNDVVAHLNVPWGHLFKDLEAFTPPNIAVLQIEPQIATNSLRWEVEAKSHQQVFAYLEKLRDANNIKRTRLIKFETNTQDQTRPIRFMLKAEIMAALPDKSPELERSIKIPPVTK